MHHQHVAEHTHKAVSDSHDHSHHHDVPEKESSKKGLLDLLLNTHNHSEVSNEIIVTHEGTVKKLIVKKELKAPFFIFIDYGFLFPKY